MEDGLRQGLCIVHVHMGPQLVVVIAAGSLVVI
jgi:hypothetical protein